MFGDPELDKLYTELQGLTNSKSSDEKDSVFSFEEDDLNVLFDKKSRINNTAPVAKQKKILELMKNLS